MTDLIEIASLADLYRLLIHEDLVAVQVFKHHPRAIRADFRFALKFHAQLFHSLVVTEAIMGLHPKIWVAAALLAQ